MLPPRKWRPFVLILAVACVVPSLSAVITETREYHGKKVTCLHSGIFSSSGRVCGTQPYARVFTGTVQSAVEVGDTDKRLQLVQDEVFLGDSASEVKAIANQACLHAEIQAGDRWLFYLYPDGKGDQLILPYDSPSKPIGPAQQDISTLRHLGMLSNSGILTGNLTRIVSNNPWKSAPVPSRNVVAKRVSDGAEYTALTDSKGHYELELPPNSYSLTTNTERGLWARETMTSVWKSGCVDVDFLLHTDGRISGRVTTADGDPARYAPVAIVPISTEGQSFAVFADGEGHFEVGGRQPGRYVVGAGLPAQPGSDQWQPSVYYPGVPTRDQAEIIELGEGQWRTDISLKLLFSSTAP